MGGLESWERHRGSDSAPSALAISPHATTASGPYASPSCRDIAHVNPQSGDSGTGIPAAIVSLWSFHTHVQTQRSRPLSSP